MRDLPQAVPRSQADEALHRQQPGGPPGGRRRRHPQGQARQCAGDVCGWSVGVGMLQFVMSFGMHLY